VIDGQKLLSLLPLFCQAIIHQRLLYFGNFDCPSKSGQKNFKNARTSKFFSMAREVSRPT